MSLSERITYATVLIKCKYKNGLSGSGTGFIIDLCVNAQKQQCIPVIVTNSHVIEGASKVTFEFCKGTPDGNPIDQEVFTVNCDIDNGGGWIHHPDPNIDLVCFRLGPILNFLHDKHVKIYFTHLGTDIIPTEETAHNLMAMEEIVMVGYPDGISDNYNHKPILRRGITATHYKNNYQGKMEFMVDMACFPGSSGSPIFILNEGAYATKQGLSFGTRILFLGVLYGGPQHLATGQLVFANIPNTAKPLIQMPNNLGVAIKAAKILDFEPVLLQTEQGGTT